MLLISGRSLALPLHMDTAVRDVLEFCIAEFGLSEADVDKSQLVSQTGVVVNSLRDLRPAALNVVTLVTDTHS